MRAEWVWLVHRVSLEALWWGDADGVCWFTLSQLMCLLKVGGVKCVPAGEICSQSWLNFFILTTQTFSSQTFHWIRSQRAALKFGFVSSVLARGTPAFPLKVSVQWRSVKVKDYLITSWFAKSILSPAQSIKIHNVCSPWSLSTKNWLSLPPRRFRCVFIFSCRVCCASSLKSLRIS